MAAFSSSPPVKHLERVAQPKPVFLIVRFSANAVVQRACDLTTWMFVGELLSHCGQTVSGIAS